MRIKTPLEFLELRSKLRICRDHFTEPHERTHYANARLNRNIAIQHAREHDRAMLGESDR